MKKLIFATLLLSISLGLFSQVVENQGIEKKVV